MNEQELDKGVNILQGIINAANTSTETPNATVETQGVLPGMEEQVESAAEAKTDEGRPAENAAKDGKPRKADAGMKTMRVSAVVSIAVFMAVAIVALVASWKLIPTRIKTVTKEVVRVKKVPTDAIPVTALCDERDAFAWRTVSNMSGTIGSVPLKFVCGEAAQLDKTYRVMLDFYVEGKFTYVKVTGNGVWVAKVDAQGNIVQSYPCRKPAIPLRQLLGGK